MTHTTEYIIDTYAAMELAALRLLSPITSETAHETALAAIDSIMERMGQDENHPLRPLFDVLIERVEAYEVTHHALPDVAPHERLAYLMDTHGLTQTALAEATGIPQSNLSAVLRGSRDFSKGMAGKLASHFGLTVAVFLSE